MQIPEIPNLIYYAIPFFIISVIVEGILLYKKHPKQYLIKDTLASLAMGIGNLFTGIIAKILVVIIITFLYENYKITSIPFTWWAWLLILFADDFCYYWAHRIGHESRFFWASHIVHHSSQKYNLSTALRQTWTGGFFSFIFYISLPILGFHPLL